MKEAEFHEQACRGGHRRGGKRHANKERLNRFQWRIGNKHPRQGDAREQRNDYPTKGDEKGATRVRRDFIGPHLNAG